MNRPLPTPSDTPVSASELLAALSFALDLTEGQPMGHAMRSCLIGMRIARTIGLPAAATRDLYPALLLKDVGCSSNSARVHALFGGDDRDAKRDLARVDWSQFLEAARYALAHAAPGASWLERARRIAVLARSGPATASELVRARCTRGAAIVDSLGFGRAVGEAVAALDEHWDGHGEPRGLRRDDIPMLSRIMSLAQTLEVFASLDGPAAAIAVAQRRAGRWFDPMLVRACPELERPIAEWIALDEAALQDEVRRTVPAGGIALEREGATDRIVEAFGAVVDAKSPFTAAHSSRVAAVAVAIAETLGMNGAAIPELRRAGLLHDIGKLSVPNAILDKPGRLTPHEWEVMRLHPYYTQRILDRIHGFESLAFIASSHHERLDGRGYHRGLRGAQLPTAARLLAVADMYDALTSERPYRAALRPDAALALLEKERGAGLDPGCLEALRQVAALERDAPLRLAA